MMSWICNVHWDIVCGTSMKKLGSGWIMLILQSIFLHKVDTKIL